MLTIKLKHSSTDWLTIENAPMGWEDIKYTITRSDMFWATNRQVTAPLVFIEDAKTYIDDIVDTYGFETEIQCELYVFVPTTRKLELLFDGVLKLSDGDYKRTRNTTEVRVIDGSFEQIVYNRRKTKVNYNNLVTADGGLIAPKPEEYEDLTLQLSQTDKTVQAVYPFWLFERIVNVITGQSNRFRSSLFANGLADGYGSIGEYALKMITTGHLLRGYNTALTTSLEDLFLSFDAIGALGMGFTTYQGQKCVQIEPKSFFFQNQVVLELTDIWDLEISLIDNLLMSEIEVGYQKQNVQENAEGQTEYNTKNTYTTPLTITDRSMKIVSSLRADGTTIEKIATEAIDENKSNPEDKDLFVIDSYLDGVLKSRKNELFGTVEGIYADYELYMNLALSPRRMIKNWDEIISIPLQKQLDKSLNIQDIETPSQLTTQLLTEAQALNDGADIPIGELRRPYLSPYRAVFSSIIGIDEILALNENRYGLVKFPNYLKGGFGYGWIKEISTSPVDKSTNIELWLVADNLELLEDTCLWMAEDGTLALAEDSGFIPCEINI
jgi:hypothetical protein